MASILDLLGLSGKKIKVTEKVEQCLEIFEDAINSMPDGESKQEALSALDYLRKAAEGKKDALAKFECSFKFIPFSPDK